MVRTYRDLVPTISDRALWTTPHVLRRRADTHGGSIALDCPEEARTWTYRDLLDAAERVGTSLLAAGGEPGDRVLILMQNSSMLVRTWLGSHMAGMVEVPINTAYRGQFLEHQTSTVGPRFAV
ncbi:MAG TPA: class I adenylate-forming enzyme family protein, partial [Acidimicrobiia bacterium]|nr:class I adenylate-forming enzyme family protein [Acidimicrobiia bacterium]